MAFTNIHALKQFKINLALQRLNVDQLATLYILAFAFIYILVPCLLYPSIFPDSAQNIAWGHTWEWSYNRHPPLGTWFIKLMDMLLGNVNLATYSASACCLSLSLWFIYKLAKQYLAAQDALVACILSSFSVFYLIYYVFQYNQNTIMLPFWVMLCYFFDLCLRKNKLQDWLIVGALSAAALLAKYESAIILFLLFGYLCFHFKRDYLIHFISAFALCLFILAPHVISVIQKGWLPWVFLQNRIVDGEIHGFFYNHFINTLQALYEQMCHITPVLLILGFLLSQKKFIERDSNNVQINYLVYLGFAPLLFALLLTLILGIPFRTEWGFPLFSFTLPALIVSCQLKTKPLLLPVLLSIAFMLHVGTLLAHKTADFFSHKDARSNFPIENLTETAETYWQHFTDKPIKYVGGEENLNYFLSAYLPSKPLLLETFSFKTSHWIKAENLTKDGILLIVDGCDQRKIVTLEHKYHVKAYKCFNIPLNDKYRQQFKRIMLLVSPPM